jgi:hypothetical protein
MTKTHEVYDKANGGQWAEGGSVAFVGSLKDCQEFVSDSGYENFRIREIRLTEAQKKRAALLASFGGQK